jgi:hypothetical protein
VEQLTKSEAVILSILGNQELYALAIVNASKHTEVRIPRGSVHVYLANLEERGLVSSRLEDELVCPRCRARLPGQPDSVRWVCNCRLASLRRELYRATVSGLLARAYYLAPLEMRLALGIT